MNTNKHLEELLDLVISQGGSDLHIFAGGSPMVRVSSALIPLTKYPAFTGEDTEAILKSIVPSERVSRAGFGRARAPSDSTYHADVC